MKNIYFLVFYCLILLSFSVNGQSNTALHFNYKDKVNVDYEMIGFTELTVESWVNLDRYHSLGNATGSPIMMQKTDPAITSHNDYGIILMVLGLGHYQGHDKQMAFGLNFGSTGIYHVGVHSGDTIRLNEWHHLAGTYDGTYMKLYIDGELVKTFNVVDSLGVQPLYSPNSGMYLGYRDEGQYGYLEGAIDDLRIWNYARSQSEIQANMYREITGNESGIYTYWDLNEGSGDQIFDKSSNGFDGFLGSSEGADVRDPDWFSSTAPIPYYTITDGNYDSSWVWASGQLAPMNDWAQVKINDNINLAADETLSKIIIGTTGEFTVDNTYTLTVDDDFLIESDATGTGSFIDDGTLSYSSATVQRYLSEDQWHYVSSPVTDATSGVFTSIYLRSWDEPTETWSYITSTTAPLNEMQGYAAWASTAYTGATTVDFTGLLNTGNYSMSLSNTTGTSAPPGEYPTGYNFIGNPYPSGIDWDDANWTKTNVDDAIYMITYIMGNRQYASYVDGISTHGATNEIAPHQGFFVKCNNTSGGSIQVTNSTRIHTGQELFKSTLNDEQYIKLTVKDANGLYDETVIRAKEGATVSFDGLMDALKLKGSTEIPQIYSSFEPETIYSINTIDHINSNTVIPVKFEAGISGIYELSFKTKDGLASLPLFVYDKKEAVLFNLKASGAYKFTASADDDPNRFELRFSYGDLQYEESINTDAMVFVKNQQVVVSLEESEFGEARVFDLSGRLITTANLFKGTNMIDVNSMNGYYLVEIITPENITTCKVFIN